MAILKSEIRNRFSTIPNSVIRDKELSDGDYRLLVYLYSLPNDWRINQAFLGQELGCARENINRKLKRIKEAGYLEIIKASEDSDVDYIYVLQEREKSVIENDTGGCDSNYHMCQQLSQGVVIPTITYTNTNITNTDDKVINNIYKKRGTFLKPTVEEIKKYCEERNNKVDAEAFYDFYESKGWLVGKNKMKDWKACVRTWEKREQEKKKTLPRYETRLEKYEREKREEKERELKEGLIHE